MGRRHAREITGESEQPRPLDAESGKFKPGDPGGF